MRYIVSACLAGVSCRYNGRHSRNDAVVALLREGRALPACPEQLGGLSTPRSPAELRRGDGRDVIGGTAFAYDERGCNVTELFLKGAVEFARLARACGARRAILKDRSPSCAARRVRVDGRLKAGRGIAAALLEAEGLELLVPADLAGRLRESRGGGAKR